MLHTHPTPRSFYMTVVTSPQLSRKLDRSPPSRSREDRIRQLRGQLDHTLATKYVQLIMRVRARNNHREGAMLKPRLELCDDPESSRVSATLEFPGLKPADISIQLDGNKLIISGERRTHIPSDTELANAKYPVKEIKYGKFERSLDVPAGTMMSTISASMNDGMLLVTWPRLPAGASPIARSAGTK